MQHRVDEHGLRELYDVDLNLADEVMNQCLASLVSQEAHCDLVQAAAK